MQRLVDEEEEQQEKLQRLSNLPSKYTQGVREKTRPKMAAFTFELHPETLRLITYSLFWLMVICAVIFHNTLVTPETLAAAATPALTDTPLVRMFGYNNVCIFWDYSPSRELTAMIYPFVEYPLIGYILLSFLQIYRGYCAGNLPEWFYRYCQVTLPIQIALFAWFRMIFVVEAFKDVVGHTLGFQGFQVALIFSSVQNALYWTVDHHDHLYIDALGRKNTLTLIWVYVGAIILTTITKLTLVLSLFLGAPVLDPHTPLGANVAETADRMWLLLCGFLPILAAYIQRRLEPGLTFTVQ